MKLLNRTAQSTLRELGFERRGRRFFRIEQLPVMVQEERNPHVESLWDIVAYCAQPSEVEPQDWFRFQFSQAWAAGHSAGFYNIAKPDVGDLVMMDFEQHTVPFLQLVKRGPLAVCEALQRAEITAPLTQKDRPVAVARDVLDFSRAYGLKSAESWALEELRSLHADPVHAPDVDELVRFSGLRLNT
jgi:hypothetical protein